MTATSRPPAASGRGTGTWLVGGMLGLAVVLAVFGVWYQWGQTRRCLEFYGSEAAHRIQSAARVELWRLADGDAATRPDPDRRRDVSQARGIVHLRRGLVEDANFTWNAPAAAPAPAPAVALAFFDDAQGTVADTVVVIRLDADGGRLEVVGRPGGLALGRIAAGLRTWLADVAAEWLPPAGAP